MLTSKITKDKSNLRFAHVFKEKKKKKKKKQCCLSNAGQIWSVLRGKSYKKILKFLTMKTLKLYNEEAVAETFIIFGNHLHASISQRKLAAE